MLRSSFRDPLDGKIKHRQHGRITGVPLQILLNVQAALRDDVLPKGDPDAFKIIESKEFGASASLLALAKDIGLDRALYSKPSEGWVKDTLAMIIGRILYQGSKLSLSHMWKNSSLWELCGTQGAVDVDKHCYEPLDRLLERQPGIQQALAKKHLANGCLVLRVGAHLFDGHSIDPRRSRVRFHSPPCCFQHIGALHFSIQTPKPILRLGLRFPIQRDLQFPNFFGCW